MLVSSFSAINLIRVEGSKMEPRQRNREVCRICTVHSINTHAVDV